MPSVSAYKAILLLLQKPFALPIVFITLAFAKRCHPLRALVTCATIDMAPARGKRSSSQASMDSFIVHKRAKVKTNDGVPIDTADDAGAAENDSSPCKSASCSVQPAPHESAEEAPAQDLNGGDKIGSADGDEGDDNDPESEAKNITIQGPDLTLKPLSNLRDIIQDLLDSAKEGGLHHFVDSNDQFYIRVGTLCSGTDAPLHVLNLFGMLKNADGEQVFTTINKFACEIEPFKQGFLLRNSKPELLFRDATDFAKPGAKQA